MNTTVSLKKRIRLQDGTTRLCPAVYSNNGRVKPDWVIVNEATDKQEHHTEGSYYLDWYEGTKRIRKSVGKNATAADAKRLMQEGVLRAKNAGIDNVKAVEGVTANGGKLLIHSVALYLQDIADHKKPRSYLAYKTALNYFLESCTKQRVEEIDRADLLKFAVFLRDEKEQAPRTVYNKFEHVMTFLKSQGIRGLVGKNDWPRFTEEEPEIYEQEELDQLFKACDEEESLWYEFFLKTGMREQEVMYAYKTNMRRHGNGHIVRVTHKPDRNWTPKAYKEREIPIPDTLAERLKAWIAKSDKNCNLLFPTSGCNPKLDFLDCLKAVAKRAELNPEDFWLHKFRSTFATRCLEHVDLRTVQLWLGHKDLESTMRYLKPSRSQHVMEKVNKIFG